MDDFDAKLKWTKADLKTVVIDVQQADGTTKKTEIPYELHDKTAHSTLYESLVQDLEKFEKYTKWKVCYDKYERAMISLEEAKYDLKYVTEAMKWTASTSGSSMARHVTVDAAWQAEALRSVRVSQAEVNVLTTAIAELKTTFNLTDLQVTTDATTGVVTIDNTKILWKYDSLILTGKWSLKTQINGKITRLGIPLWKIDVTLKAAEDAKMSILENIWKKVKAP